MIGGISRSVVRIAALAASLPYIVFGMIVRIAIFLFPPLATWLPALLGN